MDHLLSEVPGYISYSVLIPPALLILLAAVGVVLAWVWRRVGLALATVAILCLYAVSTPMGSFLLLRWADSLGAAAPPPHLTQPPGAIIVLGGDTRATGNPKHPVAPGPLTFERILAAAQQARRLQLPVLVSGGAIPDQPGSLASIMADTMQQSLGVPVRWREDRSANTFQNALYSAEILRKAGIGAAYVVTNPWHMARALWAFRRVGYPVVALPVAQGAPRLDPEFGDFLPSIPALHDSYYSLHELIGLGWYRLRYDRLFDDRKDGPPAPAGSNAPG